MNSHNTYSVLVSQYGLPTVLSRNSLKYPEFIQSGNYQVVHEGPRKECEDYAQEITEGFAEPLTNTLN